MKQYLFLLSFILFTLTAVSAAQAQNLESEKKYDKYDMYLKYQKGISEVGYTFSYWSSDQMCAVDKSSIEREIEFILNQTTQVKFKSFNENEYSSTGKKLADSRGMPQEQEAQKQFDSLMARPNMILLYNAVSGPQNACVYYLGIKVVAGLAPTKILATGISFENDAGIWEDQAMGWSPTSGTTKNAIEGFSALLKTYINAVSKANQ